MDVNSQSDFDSVISFDDTTSGNYPDGHNIVIRNCKVINSNKADAITNSWTISGSQYARVQQGLRNRMRV